MRRVAVQCSLFTLLLGWTASGLLAGGHATLAGKIVDQSGNPIQHATVLIYHAGVKHGYSTFCPSCYADCGKRITTGQDGTFVFQSLDPNLWFELLAVRSGFQPAFIKKVDPLGQLTPVGVLLPRPAATAFASVVRGRLVDDHGLPLRDSVIRPLGASTYQYFESKPTRREVSMYGTVKGLEPIAITNKQGEFEIASQKPASGMLLKIEARGFAPVLKALPTGMGRKTIMLPRGAVVRGRLLNHGDPVTGAEIGLIPRNRGGFGANLKIVGDPYEEIRVGTQTDGSFVLADIPTPVAWYIYAKMETVPRGLATKSVECATTRGGEVVNVGDLQLEAGHRLRGRVVLRDGASIPDGMRLIITSDEAWDSQVLLLHSDGRFECSGLPTGGYDIDPAVRGYRSLETIRCMPIDHDIDDLRIILERESRP